MSGQNNKHRGGLVLTLPRVFSDPQFVDVFSGPIISAEAMREYGRQALEAFRPELKKTGRHADPHTPYMETWAERYWRSQQAIERSRLRTGMAKHRAHRDPIPGKPATK